ncbi:MAG: transglutaminaseTgpA domain-containing protein, partial [Persicimonas sp.]
MHKTSVYLVVGLAFACVAVGGGVGPLMSAFFFVGMLVSWFVDRAGIIDKSFARWWNLLILGFVAVTALQILVSEESIISAALRFVLLLSLVKLFGRFSARDDLQLYALSFLLFAAATAVNEGVTYGILFALYVFAGTFSLALFHLTCEFDDRQITATSEQTPFDRQYMAVLGALSLVIFLSSMAIFFVFPRVGLGFFISQSRDQVDVTGFSESVELGSHGAVRDNPQVVMRVEFPDGRPERYQSLHWRTMTFDHYDGNRWSQTLEEDSEDPLPRQQNRYRFDKRFDETRRGFGQQDDPLELDIYLEPLGTNLLPRLWPTGVVRLGSEGRRVPWDPNDGDVTADAYSDIRHTIESEIGVIYGLTKLADPDPAKLREQQFSDTAGRPDARFLQLPEDSNRLRELADEAAADARTPYAKAEAVADFLQREYRYTTDLPEVDRATPVDSFLFDTKRGHCEYFATAAALLLRSQDVP